MKRFVLFAGACFSLLFVFTPDLKAQGLTEHANYVVIGAFARLENAINFTEDARRHDLPAKFEMNSGRKLYYVYVLTTADRQYARDQAMKLRSGSKYFDTWVYSRPSGESTFAESRQQSGEDIDPETGELLSSVTIDQHISPVNALSTDNATTAVTTENDYGPERNSLQHRPTVERNGLATGEGADRPFEPPPTKVSVGALQTEDVEGKDFYFHLFRADNLRMVDGEVDVIDFERSRKMASYAGNTPVTVRMPSGKLKQVSFVCQVFGYRKQQKEFDPGAPADDLYLDDKGNIVVPFELVRLQKGDIAIMYNVFFFKDAAVIRPESRFEVNNLLDLLNENPSYKIRIHGHTNGNANGKIIRMDKPGNFYSLSGTKEGFGSAKKLSGERAAVIKQYLVSSGISEDRMEIQAWGGKKPIHDKHSVRANENVRVEIEILSE